MTGIEEADQYFVHKATTVPNVVQSVRAGQPWRPLAVDEERSGLVRARKRLGQMQIVRRAVGSVYGATTDDRSFAVTFDDGPDPRVTPRVLELLAAHNMKATFFMRADRALANPALARDVAAAGHEVGVHGYSHERMTELGIAGIRRETVSARRELRRLVGTNPHWFRPPYGAQNLRTFLATRVQGMDVAVWDVDPSDAMVTAGFAVKAEASGSLTLRAAGSEMSLAPGSIILLHDTPAADDSYDGPARKIALIARLIDGVTSVGGRIVTLTELLRRGAGDRRIWRSPGY